MIAKWILAALGLGVTVGRDNRDVEYELRRTDRALFQHELITAKADQAARAIASQRQSDDAPERLLSDAEQTREVLRAALERM